MKVSDFKLKVPNLWSPLEKQLFPATNFLIF